MLIKFISLGGYGFYVWPAFIFTFTGNMCSPLLLKLILLKMEIILLEMSVR